MFTPTQIDRVTLHALIALLWTGTGDEGEPLDSLYEVENFAPSAVAWLTAEIAEFMATNAADINWMELSQLGHDYILTRNGEGVGFWDRGLGARGDRLTVASQLHHAIRATVGDDGSLYIEG